MNIGFVIEERFESAIALLTSFPSIKSPDLHLQSDRPCLEVVENCLASQEQNNIVLSTSRLGNLITKALIHHFFAFLICEIFSRYGENGLERAPVICG